MIISAIRAVATATLLLSPLAHAWTLYPISSSFGAAAAPLYRIPMVTDSSGNTIIAFWSGSTTPQCIVATLSGSTWSYQTIFTLPSDDPTSGAVPSTIWTNDVSLAFASNGDLFLAANYNFLSNLSPNTTSKRIRIYRRTAGVWSPSASPFGQSTFTNSGSAHPFACYVRIQLAQHDSLNGGVPLLGVMSISEGNAGDTILRRTLISSFANLTLAAGSRTIISGTTTSSGYAESTSSGTPVTEIGEFNMGDFEFVAGPSGPQLLLTRNVSGNSPVQHFRGAGATGAFAYKATLFTPYESRLPVLAIKNATDNAAMWTYSGGQTVRRNFTASTETWSAPVAVAGTAGATPRAVSYSGFIPNLVINKDNKWYWNTIAAATLLFDGNSTTPPFSSLTASVDPENASYFAFGLPSGAPNIRITSP